MIDFQVIDCPPPTTLNFFHSGDYVASSYSTGWRTKDIPETEGLGSVPVYQQVLNKFNIPIDSSQGLPPGGFLPGIDIRNMDAVKAISLSIAEALLDGQWWELIENAEGGVHFVNVFNNGSPGKTVNLDVRLCIPSASKDNIVDMVVVRGYKKPPQRYAGPWRDVVPAGTGTINPVNVLGNEPVFTVYFADMVGTCVSSQLKTTATKSYRDPTLSDQLGPQEKNPFYDVQAFEDIISYAVDIDGMPEDSGSAASVKYSFNKETTWFVRTDFPTFSKVTSVTAGGCEDGGGNQTGGEVVFYEGKFIYRSPTTTDRYGDLWPLVLKPTSLLYTGYKVQNVISFGPIGGDDSSAFVFVDPVHEFNELGEGSQWIYTVEGPGEYEIKMYYQPKQDPTFWDIILDLLTSGDATIKVGDGRVKVLDTANDMLASATGLGVLGGQNDLGHYLTNFWLGVTLERPSVTITAANGDALSFASSLRIQYAPLILKNEPPPVAYTTGLDAVIVDQTVGLRDQDPTTCQTFEETPLAVMQNRMTGNTTDVSLPFCADGDACLLAAQTIYNYQSHLESQTFTLTCGPDDMPELGAAVNGYATDLRIMTINYSFQDSSAYTIEVTLGPVFVNVGSWNDGAWLPETADVQRKAIVIWTAGDGVNYRVQVQGLGEYNAINSKDMIWRVGETVEVTVYNIPQEAI